MALVVAFSMWEIPLDAMRLQDKILRGLVANGYRKMTSEGLVSEFFLDTFAPSAFHREVCRAVQKGALAPGRYCGVDWVYRHFDEPRIINSRRHLSCFRMLVAFEVCTEGGLCLPSVVGIVEEISRILNEPEIDLQHLLFECYEPSRSEHKKEQLLSMGIEKVVGPFAKLIKRDDPSLMTNIRREKDPGGPRCEVYFEMRPRYSLEVGTIVSEIYSTVGGEAGAVPAVRDVVGFALGVERLCQAVSGAEDIFEVCELQDAADIALKGYTGEVTSELEGAVRELVDSMRTLEVLASQIGGRNLGKRRRRVNTIVRRIRRHLEMLGIEPSSRRMQVLWDEVTPAGVENGVASLEDVWLGQLQ